MADTIELQKHIKDVEDKLKDSITTILSELKLPMDFSLNSIDVDFLTGQELGHTRKFYALNGIKLNVSWEPDECRM